MKFLLGKKIEMSQLFDEKGNVVPITLISAGPCYITQIKTKERDGYESAQVGFEKIEKKNKIKKTMKGKEFRYLKEFGIRNSEFGKNVNDIMSVSDFKEGEKVTIIGVSKGKGFQGGVKRHGFSGRNASHGMKHEARTIGSIGQRFPQHTIKGRRMPGRMGGDRITVKNLTIVKINAESNLLAVKGAVQGHRGTLLQIMG